MGWGIFKASIACTPYGDGSLLETYFYDKYCKPIPLIGKSVDLRPELVDSQCRPEWFLTQGRRLRVRVPCSQSKAARAARNSGQMKLNSRCMR